MGTDLDTMDHLLDELKAIEENALYTAQTHFVIADKAEHRARLMLILPSVAGALSGFSTALGAPDWVGALGGVAGMVTGIAAALGVDRHAAEHRQAANRFTALRHEARLFHEALWREVGRSQLVAEVRRINDRYNWMLQGSLATDEASFEKARERIKKGRLGQDFRA